MSVSLTVTARSHAAVSSVEIPQLRIRGIFAVWAAAALPMAVLAWLVAPALADRFAGEGHVPMAKALIVSLATGCLLALLWGVLPWRRRHESDAGHAETADDDNG